MKKCRWFFLPLLLISCTGDLFEELGTNLAEPISVAVDPANQRAYLVNSNNELRYENGSLLVLDISNPAAPQRLTAVSPNPIPLANFSGQAYLDPARRLLFLPNRASENKTDLADPLLRIALDEAVSPFGQVESFNIGENPFGIACCDASGRGFVTTNAGSLVAFDSNDPSIQTSISLRVVLSTAIFSGRGATRVAVTSDQIFVSDLAGIVYVVNASDLSIDYVLTQVGVPRGLLAEAADPDGDGPRGRSLYIIDSSSALPLLRVIPLSSIPVLDSSEAMKEMTISSIEAATISLGTNPQEIVFLIDKAFVTNRGDDTISVISLANTSVETKIEVGDEPFGLSAFTALNGTSYLYVTNIAANTMSVIDLSSNSVVATFTN
ncbi:MAG: hypothetical protein HYT76_07745 [Deltaproteobacteria bacterium]|nr:hypothetical protein [Deltaproteobacteria bacterium]